jgi:hypothetical protein
MLGVSEGGKLTVRLVSKHRNASKQARFEMGG